MVIFVGRDELRLADVIDHFDFVDDLNREGQLGDPGRAVGLIFKEVAGRRRLTHSCCCPHVVAHLGQDVGFDPAADIQGFVMALGLCRKVVAPEEGRGAGAEYIGKLHGVGGGCYRSAKDGLSNTPAIAQLIEPDVHTVEVHIDEVCAAGSIQIGEKEPPGIKIDAQMRRIGHCDAFPESAIAEVGPVVDSTVVNQDDVVQSTTSHAG